MAEAEKRGHSGHGVDFVGIFGSCKEGTRYSEVVVSGLPVVAAVEVVLADHSFVEWKKGVAKKVTVAPVAVLALYATAAREGVHRKLCGRPEHLLLVNWVGGKRHISFYQVAVLAKVVVFVAAEACSFAVEDQQELDVTVDEAGNTLDQK